RRQHPATAAHPASRSRTRARQCLPAAAAQALASRVRTRLAPVSGALPGTPREPPLRASPGRVVRAGASERGLRRDVRSVADAEIRLAQDLRGLYVAAHIVGG